jgi:Na+/H+ antiporter NhaD/arsenite permease-like protein
MPTRRAYLAFLGVLASPAEACAAHEHLDLPIWSVAPFALLLLSIAILPLVASRFWHSNRNRAIVAAVFAVPVVLYLIYLRLTTGQETLWPLVHELLNYVSFIVLLGSLYTVAGGIVVRGNLGAGPFANTAFLASGAALANLIGTTGASVLLIRPLLRANRWRRHTIHLPIFFIFTVSNLGGLLTPLGDPPLFLGFLNGVPFFWTLSLWPQWLLANGLVLVVFFVWDSSAYRREPATASKTAGKVDGPLRVEGFVNCLLLAGIMVAVLIEGPLPSPWAEIAGGLVMLILGVLSLRWTPHALREANGFTWAPMAEVAILFAGIFVTMVPALEWIGAHSAQLGVSQPWQFFWLTGVLSASLDNAPTYLTFTTLAAGSTEFGLLVRDEVPGLAGPLVLQAISCGAVFGGAMTYIGNGPNFMVKAIAAESGYRTPSYFGYLVYSSAVLIPVFVLITLFFFRSA